MIISILLFAHVALAWAEQATDEAELIAAEIADFIQTDQAIFLDLRCGEWTPALSKNLSRLLLERSMDIRDVRSHSLFADITENGAAISLGDYGLDRALLVQVNMNIKWHTEEQKSFFSYRTKRKTVHSFEVKQLQIPQHRLLQIDSYDYVLPDSPDDRLSAPRLRWFEPLIATTAIASIIFLLWTIE